MYSYFAIVLASFLASFVMGFLDEINYYELSRDQWQCTAMYRSADGKEECMQYTNNNQGEKP